MSSKTFIGTFVLAIGLVLGMGPADAGPRAGATGKRDVIGDAEAICGGSPAGSLQDACDLLAATNGEQDLFSEGCNSEFDLTDNGVVTYSLRNCDKNEEALLRLAASAVLSIEDFLEGGKDQQLETAADYLCKYSAKATALDGVGKFDDGAEDLAADAEIIADDIGFACL